MLSDHDGAIGRLLRALPDHDGTIRRWRDARNRACRLSLLRWRVIAGQTSRLRACEEWARTMCVGVCVKFQLHWSMVTVFKVWRRLSQVLKLDARLPRQGALKRWHRNTQRVLMTARRAQNRQGLMCAVLRWRLRSMWLAVSMRLTSSHWVGLALRRAMAVLSHAVTCAGYMAAAASHDRRKARRRVMGALAEALLRTRYAEAVCAAARHRALRRGIVRWSSTCALCRSANMLLTESAGVHRRKRFRRQLAIWRRSWAIGSAMLEV
jgi:hypothetical protein